MDKQNPCSIPMELSSHSDLGSEAMMHTSDVTPSMETTESNIKKEPVEDNTSIPDMSTISKQKSNPNSASNVSNKKNSLFIPFKISDFQIPHSL